MQWEYQTLKLAVTGFFGGNLNEAELAQQLNELGSDGWEMVTAIDLNMGNGASRNVVIVLKRQRGAMG